MRRTQRGVSKIWPSAVRRETGRSQCISAYSGISHTRIASPFSTSRSLPIFNRFRSDATCSWAISPNVRSFVAPRRRYAAEATEPAVSAAQNASELPKPREKPITSRPDLRGYTREEIEALRYRGQSPITSAVKQLDLREVAVVLFRAQRYPTFEQEKIFAAWLAGLARLRSIHQVTTLGEFLTMNRVAWWRLNMPSALRRLMNQAMYHQRWETHLVDAMAKVAEKKGLGRADGASTGSDSSNK